MQLKLHLLAAGTAAVVMLGACVDDNYSLDDIDTTTRITVDNLTLPVNIDAVTLSDVITYDDDSRIKPISLGGNEFYALTESGTFESEDIYIDRVTSNAPHLEDSHSWLPLLAEHPFGAKAALDVPMKYVYHIDNLGNDFSYDSDDIDHAVDALYSAEVQPLTFSIDLRALNIDDDADFMTFSDLKILMPKGLTATASHGTYDPETGIWAIDNYDVNGTRAFASLTATAIDFEANGVKIINHSMHFSSQFRLTEGYLIVEPKSVDGVLRQLPESLEFTVKYGLSDLEVNSLTGRINYKLKGMDIAPVSLSDIPDFLSDPETKLMLENPQIYLQVNNPVADNSLDCRTGITLTANRPGSAIDYRPDNGFFTIGYDKGEAGPYNFVLAPHSEGLTTPAEYTNPTFVPFSTLGRILAGTGSVTGIPESIGIHLDDPEIPSQDVVDFRLGRTLPGAKGSYELIAPLALSAGSSVVYSDRETGWNDDDVDAIVINTLRVRFTASNNCPLAVDLMAYPLDVEGKRLQGLELATTATLEAGAQDQAMEIVLTGGEVRHLDGIEYVARVHAGTDGTALQPSQTIVLKNIRATVGGYYEKEL